MKRGFITAVAGAAIVVAGLAGCSSKSSSAPPTASSSSASSAPGSAAVGAGQTKVTIDGQDQTATGTLTCTAATGKIDIVSSGGGVQHSVVLNDANPPTVISIGLKNTKYTLTASAGGPGNANVSKDGNSYKITDTAGGPDLSNPMAGVANKSFEIDATCTSS